MASSKQWDLTSTNALQGAAEWLLKRSGALLVVIVRVDDLAISADPQLAPRESTHLLEDRMPGLHAVLQAERVARQNRNDRKTKQGRLGV